MEFKERGEEIQKERGLERETDRQTEEKKKGVERGNLKKEKVILVACVCERERKNTEENSGKMDGQKARERQRETGRVRERE